MEAWSKFDPTASGRIPLRDLTALLRLLPPPLGLDPSDYPQGVIRSKHVLSYAYQMGVEVHETDNPNDLPYVRFTDVLACLVKDTYASDKPDDEDSDDEEHGDSSQQMNGSFVACSHPPSAEASKMRKSRSWTDVLPPPTSKVGVKYREFLNRNGAMRSPGAELDGESASGYLRNSIAASQLGIALKKRLLQRRAERSALLAEDRAKLLRDVAVLKEQNARLRAQLQRLERRREGRRPRDEDSASAMPSNPHLPTLGNGVVTAGAWPSQNGRVAPTRLVNAARQPEHGHATVLTRAGVIGKANSNAGSESSLTDML